ncbi:MAG: DUF937 domain-containing protein [Planctomycetota bacterium]
MSSLIDLIKSQIGEQAMGAIGKRIGADDATTRNAIGAALPTMIGAMQRNARTPEGARSLEKALDRDHDGGLLDNLQSHFSGQASGRAANGDGIAGHLFGKQREKIEGGLGQTVGLSQQGMGQLMSMLGPVVLGSLGRQKKAGGFDASGLSGLLGKERAAIDKKDPQAGSFLGRMFDQDGDGDFDLGDAATGLFKKFF